MINFLFKRNSISLHIYIFKPLGNHTLKIMKKYLEIYFKIWKNHGNIMEFYQSEKVGTLNGCQLYVSNDMH